MQVLFVQAEVSSSWLAVTADGPKGSQCASSSPVSALTYAPES